MHHCSTSEEVRRLLAEHARRIGYDEDHIEGGPMHVELVDVLDTVAERCGYRLYLLTAERIVDKLGDEVAEYLIELGACERCLGTGAVDNDARDCAACDGDGTPAQAPICERCTGYIDSECVCDLDVATTTLPTPTAPAQPARTIVDDYEDLCRREREGARKPLSVWHDEPNAHDTIPAPVAARGAL